ncbi:MAG: GNAT family N-acetyltransferase [Anaerolineae bacterium]|jgi:ribosomal-protein-alanine N-acetyltransferase
MTIPTITTPRLVLRAFTTEDVEPMYHILRGEDVLRYFPPMEPPPQERVRKMVSGLLKHWETRGYGLWAVESPSSGQLMGRCGLQWLPDTEEVEVDYILGRPFWGQGFATEAARTSLRYGFEELELERVVGIAHVENIASQRVMEKLGMARLEQREFFGIPCYRYAVERSAFEEASGSWENDAPER